jgi:Fe2+ or Zn2+ uptake regulation protein
MGQPYPGKWSFTHHPWLREMHDSTAELNIGQKSAQAGYTETVLNRTFFNIDVKGVDCLYVLPAKTPDASDFSAARFDPALELSAHLSKMFSDVKNVGHKRAGTTNLYIRGSRSRAGLKSVPVGFIVLDELDEMTQENIPLALERASGQVEHSTWMISTATIDNYGINFYYNQSSKNHFFFTCPSCSKWVDLTFPDSLKITATELDDPDLKKSHLICKECKATLPHETKPTWLGGGKWVEGRIGIDSKGWHVNQLYSCTVRPDQIAGLYLRSQADKAAEQEFYNSKLGVPHVVDGARVTDKQLDDCKSDHLNGALRPSGLVTMGVDVGSWLHFEVDQWFLPDGGIPGGDLNIMTKCRILRYGKVRDFEELDLLMREWNVHYCVIDAQPERRKALEFANRFYGMVKVCYYPNGIANKTLHLNDEEMSVSVDRTSWLDLSLGRFRRGKPWMSLPIDLDHEYRTHVKALVRIYEKDKKTDNPIGRYVKGSDHDHYAHARNYAEIALPLAANLAANTDITGLY